MNYSTLILLKCRGMEDNCSFSLTEKKVHIWIWPSIISVFDLCQELWAPLLVWLFPYHGVFCLLLTLLVICCYYLKAVIINILTKCVLHGECVHFLRGHNLESRFWTRVWTQDYGDIFRKYPPDLKVTCTLNDIKFYEVSDKQNLRNKLEMITWREHFEI